MISVSQVSWGPYDALERDSAFLVKWIEPDNIKECLLTDKWIVSGEKGSGKSAIRKAISEIYRDQYDVIQVVDFNKVEFDTLCKNLNEIAKLTSLSKTKTLSNFWQYAIIIALLRECHTVKPKIYGHLIGPVQPVRMKRGVYEQLIGLVEDIWNSIDTFTGIGAVSPEARATDPRFANLIASGGLTAEFLSQLSEFPLDDLYHDLKKQFFSLVEERGHTITAIFDGLDRLKVDESSSSGLSLIFASLIDAIQTIRIDVNLPPTINFKALIPHDRYLALPLRDSDKISALHASIRWDKQSLQEFLRKRIEVSTSLKGNGFQIMWRQVMPEWITNTKYNLQEDSFEYIVRHSLYRPRHLQIHLTTLASRHRNKNIDPSMVPSSIAASSEQITRYFINEYSTDFPFLLKLIQLFHRRDNIMEYKHFRDIVGNGMRKSRMDIELTLESIVNLLYEIGFFGIVNFIDPGENVDSAIYCPPTKEGRKHYVDFFYKSPTPKVSVSGFLTDTSVVALHPIFVHFANLRTHPNLIVG